MEFFTQAKVVRLRSHLNKFLIADDDEKTVRQSRNGSSGRSRWTVEMVVGRNNVIRLKSCSSGKYLTPSSEPFLTGMTGKKVVQDIQANKRDTSLEWEPIEENGLVKLKSKDGKFLRANGSMPPWRNSVTHDLPQISTTKDWLLWGIDVVVLESQESFASNLSPRSNNYSPRSSFSSVSEIQRVRVDSRPVAYKGSPLAGGRQSGMDLFDRAKKVRLQSFHNKYLVADDDGATVRQSRNGSSASSRWTVEYLEKNPYVIRLKSCHGLYLSATSESFLLGMTGKKVQQYTAQLRPDCTTEWEPIKEGASHVKLRSCDGKFLRANGGTPPWNNSITHDIPHRTATQNWVFWEVDVVDISLSDDTESVMSSLSTLSSTVDSSAGSLETGSPRISSFQQHTGSPSRVSRLGKDYEKKLSSGMECFRKAKTIRLKSHHGKYLLAHSDGENVAQHRNSPTNKANWTVEFVNGFDSLIRLKSVNGKYLTASEESNFLGITGRKVVQSLPGILDSSIEWEPICDGFQVSLKTRYGSYLLANGESPPFRNSITHRIPSRLHHDWMLWDAEIVETIKEEQPQPQSPKRVNPDLDLDSSSFRLTTPKAGPSQLNETFGRASLNKEGRTVYYTVLEDARNDGGDGYEEKSFTFDGRNMYDLTQDLEDQTGLEDIIICSRNPLNEKLMPLRLALPPNNAAMHVVVVPSTSKVARGL